jgi:TRAP-type C4-dicarboxylate transport system substrate-binding protein
MLLFLAAQAHADPVRIRFAAIVPEGTGWARDVASFGREVSETTRSKIQLKWYLGGIAGDEFTTLDRIRRGQLDGFAGALACERLAPSLKVLRLPGLLRDRDEMHHVLARLHPRIEQEMARAGFVPLVIGTLGMVHLFTREPVRTMAELRATKLWVWNLDDLIERMLPEMGIPLVPLDPADGGTAYEQKRIDGFLSVTRGALAFQWSARSRAFTDLPISGLPACLVVAQRAIDPLPLEDQQAIRTAAARLSERFESLSRVEEDSLIGGLFERQGLKRVRASATFLRDYFEAARLARERVGGTLVPGELITQILGWLADYRAERASSRR